MVHRKYLLLSLAVVHLSCLLAVSGGYAHSMTRGPPLGPYRRARQTPSALLTAAGSTKPYIEQCKVYYRNATLDHFSWVCTSHLAPFCCALVLVV